MDLREYYNLPEGTNVSMSIIPSFFDGVDKYPYPCPPSMEYAFAYYGGKTIPVLDTSNVTNMKNMFSHCEKFISIGDLSNWNTSNVTDMSYMFYYGSSLTSLGGLSNWDTSNVTTMNYMFQYCTKLTSVNGIENWDVSNVTTMNYMFGNCNKITSIDISNWDTSNIKNMGGMFDGCSKLETLSSINCSGIAGTNNTGAGIFGYGGISTLKNFGGWIGLKSSVTSYGIDKCKNLTYESCINVLNGLYDFVGNAETPTSTQGKLKVSQNFLDLVGDEISIGTNKGWTITA